MEQNYNDNRYVKKWANVKRAMDLLGGKCQSCGETHVATLSFHHSDPEQKEHLVSHLVKGRDWVLIEKEVKKCDLLCENCHRKTHFDDERYNRLFQAICNKASGKKTGKEINIKKWSDDETVKLIEFYNLNLSIQEIAHRMSRMDCTIRSRISGLKEEGVLTERDKSLVLRKTSVSVTNELKLQIKQLSEQFLSPLEISSKLGVSLRTVFKFRKGE